MLTQVVLQTSDPVTFNIDNADPNEILILTSISGLTPQDVSIFSGDFARDGGYYQGRRVGGRFPVFNFKINPNYAEDIEVSDIREMLYRQFYEPQPDTDGVQVLLKDDRKPDRYLTVYGEKWDGEIFERYPKAQISTVCVDAYIKSVLATSNQTEGGWLALPIEYDGSADTGIAIDLQIQADTTSVVVENNSQIMVLNGDFHATDTIGIGTVEGNRYIRHNGIDKMVLLQPPNKWIQLQSQNNLFKFYGSAPGDGKVVAKGYSFQSAWRGV